LNWKRVVAAEEAGPAVTFTRLEESQSWLKDALFKGVVAYLEQMEAGL
jgi:hypothetical protein